MDYFSVKYYFLSKRVDPANKYDRLWHNASNFQACV